MAVPVILPTFGKSRKTTKSDPSTGDQLGKREFLFKPVSTKFRAVPCRAGGRAVPCRAGAVPCRAVPCRAVPCRCRAVPCRAVPCRAVPCRADRWVNGGSNKEPLI